MRDQLEADGGADSDECRSEPSYTGLAQWGKLAAGRQMQDLPPLFPRVETAKAKGSVETAAGAKTSKAPVPAGPDDTLGLVDIETFGQVDLRSARVLGAERVEGSKKLLKLLVDCGPDQRQIVAGIAKAYTPGELVLMRQLFSG